MASRARKPGAGFSICVSTASVGWAPSKTIRIAAMRTLTAGPASATTTSSSGFSGMRSSWATPPMGSNVIFGVLMP